MTAGLLLKHPLLLALALGACLNVSSSSLLAETPGEFRPRPVLNPAEKAGGTGAKVQPPDTLPKSRAPIPAAERKPKLAKRGEPILRGNELVFSAGWELAEAPRLKADGAALSQPGVDTRDWYDATVPGTVLTTLVEQGVYPDPYFGLNNLAIPESLNKQDYWYRTEFTVPAAFAGRELWLQFGGINYYAEVWLNGEYLGHITGAFIRGEFNVTRLAKPGTLNVLAVMVAPPPDPGIPSEQSVKFGPGDNGGALCLDGPTFVCSEGWDWIPAIRDRCTGLWQDVVLRATGPVTLGDPQVITELPLPDVSPAAITVQTELRNASSSVQQGTLKGSFEGTHFEQPVTLQAGETKTIAFLPKQFPQLTLRHPRLWWPNGYGRPELYHLQLSFITKDKRESDRHSARFGVRELSYELAVKKPDGQVERVEFRPTLARGESQPVIDNRRDTMLWGPENKEKRTQVAGPGAKPPTTPFWWGESQAAIVGVWPGAEHSPALRPVSDSAMGPFLVVKVNGQKIECVGGNWGMDDGMKRISREHLEPYVRLHRDANLTMIRNWSGQSTSEIFYDLCDEYGLLVWNDFWLNTEGWNYNPADNDLFLRNVADTLKRYRTHPSIALWCPRNEGVPPQPLNEGIDRLIRELDGTRYYQPNSRLVNLRNSGPWSNLPLEKYFQELNQGFSTEMGASSIPSAEVMRSMMPEADLWPTEDVWAYHDLHSKGSGDRGSIFGRISKRYGEAQNLEDLCRKAQMVNYETYRAIYEGFNSKLWKSCSGVLVWMSHPSWPSVVWQFYTWDYEPNASLFGAKKAAEPVHIQMNLPDCGVAVINHRAAPLTGVTATASIYNLAGRQLQSRHSTLTAGPNAATDAFTLNWPANGACLAQLELRDKKGRLLSDNFYWHARNEQQLQQLNQLPKAALTGKLRAKHSAGGLVIEAKFSNPGSTPALAIKLTLRDSKTGRRILPAYYSDNYFSLLPGQSRDLRIESTVAGQAPQLDLDGWNITPSTLR
jgi:hypothetical protein